jgi:hypothetical protein
MVIEYSKFLIFIFILLFIALVESVFIHFAKNEKRDCGILLFTIHYKILAILIALVIVSTSYILIAFISLLIAALIIYIVQILITLGVILLVWIFFWANSLVVKKYSVEVEHLHNFKKGNILRATGEYSGRSDSKTVCTRYNYKYIGDSDYDYIKVVCIDPSSSWYLEEREFKESYFTKKK